MRLALAVLLGVALSGCGCGRPVPPGPSPPGAALRVLRMDAPASTAQVPTVRVQIAADPDARARGLMGRDLLRPDTGMLFLYPDARDLHFWMKDCRHPLSAAFLDAAGRILNVAEMLPGTGVADADLPMYDSKGKARFVLEMEGGWFLRHGIGEGAAVDLSEAVRGVEVR